MTAARIRQLVALGGALALAAVAAAFWIRADEKPAVATRPAASPPAEPTAEAAAEPGLIEPEAVMLAPPAAAPPKSREEQRFDRADRDRDGRITQAEYLANRRRNFDRLDVNHDGKLSFEEYAAQGIRRFAELDSGRDGWLSRAEFAVSAPRARNRQTASVEACRCPDEGSGPSVDEP
ncbi:MAG: histidine kinase [Sphingomonadaceae bacterium]